MFTDTSAERTGHQKQQGENSDLSQSGSSRIRIPRIFSNDAVYSTRAQPHPGRDILGSILPDVLQKVRQTLIGQETAFQQQWVEETFSSLWAHSSRVARIAGYLAEKEGYPTQPALLAGLFHDMGKFANGQYHTDDIPEEKNAALLTEQLLTDTIYEKWISSIKQAILSCYLGGEATNELGRIVFDADCLDKLGSIGIAQFFAKKAMRRQFLDEQLMIRMSVELTYAHHAPDMLKTVSGRALAKTQSLRTKRFYTDLAEEWNLLGLGDVAIMQEDIAGIVCVFVVPCSCSCGGHLSCATDIRDAVKCRSAIVSYRCLSCNSTKEFSFCLPDIDGLPVQYKK